MRQFAVEINNLSARYRTSVAISDLTLTIRHGEVFGLLGPNGAGKTTLFRMITGEMSPASGEVRVLGGTTADAAIRRRIGYVPERYALHDHLTVREALTMYGSLSGVSAAYLHQRIERVLSELDLQVVGNRPIKQLSRGLQQRMAIAQAILHEPDLILLDEPASALDPSSRNLLRFLVHQWAANGKTVVINSHLLIDIEQMCSRIAVMVKGKIVISGEIGELTRGITLEERYVQIVSES